MAFLLILIAFIYAYSQVRIGGRAIRDNGTGGLFRVNTSSPATDVDGQISISAIGDSDAVWVWIDGNRYQFDLTLDNPAQDFVLLETGDFVLQEDGSSKIFLEN